MSKLNPEQRNYLKGVTSNKKRKAIKKAFKVSNRERPIEDCKLFLEDFFALVTNPLFGDFRSINTSDFLDFKKVKKLIKKINKNEKNN